MEHLTIILLAELYQKGRQLSGPREPIQIELNSTGISIKKNAVTDIFFDGIQLRLYFSGVHTDNLNVPLIQGRQAAFYMIFENNENDQGLSFEALHQKLSGVWTLSSV